MAEPFTDRHLPLWPFGLFAAAGLIALVSPRSVLDFWSLSPWTILVCLVIGIGGLRLPVTVLAVDADGVRVMQTRSRGMLVRWEEATAIRIAQWTHWVNVGRGKYEDWRLQATPIFQMVNSAGIPIVVKDESVLPLHALVTEANAHTPHLACEWRLADGDVSGPILERVGDYVRVPRAGASIAGPISAAAAPPSLDSDIRLRPTDSKGRTRFYAIVWLAVTIPIALYVRPWLPDDEHVGWVVTFAPSLLIVPLWLIAALSEFAVPRYDLTSTGDRYSITKATIFWKKHWEGRWSDVTATRVDISTRSRSVLFAVDRRGDEPIELRGCGFEVIEWIADRAPLPYGWADLTGTNRPILEGQGPLARVARDISRV